MAWTLFWQIVMLLLLLWLIVSSLISTVQAGRNLNRALEKNDGRIYASEIPNP